MKKMKSIRYGNALVCSCLAILFLFSVAQAADVTDSIHVSSSRSFYNSRTGEFSFNATLENISSDNFSPPIIAVISNLSSAQVTVSNPDGTDSSGNPYFDYSGLLGDDNTLSAGEVSVAKKWIFHNPRNVRFTYDAQIIAGAGPADNVLPSISITNPVNNSTITEATPYVTIEFSDEDSGVNMSSFYIQINGTDSTGLFNITDNRATCQVTSFLAPGANVISATICDNAGNPCTCASNFTISSSTEPDLYIFSVSNNDWIFASPGDGTCSEYLNREDLGLSDLSDVVSVSRARPGDNLFFTLSGQGCILQSPCYGSNGLYFTNTQLGIGNNDQICAEHTGLDGSTSFSVEGDPDIYQSSGLNANSFYMQNAQLGLADSVQVSCLHIGYDNKIYFCRSDQSGIFQSDGGGTNSQFLTAADLGVPGSIIDGFAILPETIPPEITITNPMDGAFLYTTTPNIQITFQDSGSGIDTATFYAEINGMDMTSAFTVTGTGATYQVPSALPLPVGDNSMLVRIRDRVGNEASATSDFSLGILRAIPGATPTSGPAPLTVYFTTDGEDPSGTIEVFRWDFDGNGTWDNYNTVARDYNHTYNTPGTYNATLYVRSSTGKTATESTTITVENNPPVATADVVPSNGEVPLTVTLSGSGSDPDGSIVLYEWDFEGDGTYEWSSATSGNTTHTYTAVGTFNAVFRVMDDNGLTDTATAATTVVRAGPPGSPTATASATPTSGNAPLTVNFNGTATDPDNDIVLYEWDFDGDGTYDWSSATTGSASHTYNTAGTHVASFRVTDAEGLTGIDQILITVNIQTSLSIQRDTVGFPSGTGMTASASSQYSSSYAPSRAIDGNTSTRWQTSPYGASGSWFEVSFNTPQRVSGFTITWYNVYNYKVSRAKIEAYDLSGNIIHSEETDFSGYISQVSLPQVENVTRLRLTTINYTNSNYVIIKEFEVDSTPMPGSQAEPTGTNINTSVSAGTPVSILIKDSDGNTVRTLVNNEYRNMGTYADYWDCKDDNGIVVNDGVHYAILQYIVDGQVQTYDLTSSTGGARYNFPTGSGCDRRDSMAKRNFSPYEDDFSPITFRLCKASEVTVFIGPLWSGSSTTRIRTIINRKVLPAGSHRVYWDGLDDQGNIAHPPPGDSLILGMWRYTLPNNAIYMTGGRPVISNVSSDPNYFNPLSNTCLENGDSIRTTYTASEDVNTVELRVISLSTKNTARVVPKYNVAAGENFICWDGRNNNGDFVDAGDYQLVLTATDAEGNDSMLTSVNLIRLAY